MTFEREGRRRKWDDDKRDERQPYSRSQPHREFGAEGGRDRREFRDSRDGQNRDSRDFQRDRNFQRDSRDHQREGRDYQREPMSGQREPRVVRTEGLAFAAMEAATKINALLTAKGSADIDGEGKSVDPLSGLAVIPQFTAEPLAEQLGIDFDDRKEIEDLEFTEKIDINDTRNRYFLASQRTLDELETLTGAKCISKGKYYPDRSLALQEREPPLYLHVTASTREILDEAIKWIKEIKDKGQSVLGKAKIAAATSANPTKLEDNGIRSIVSGGKPAFCLDIQVGLGEIDASFNARARIMGPENAYAKHIQSSTEAKVQVRGKGSGFFDPAYNGEEPKPMYVQIVCSKREGVEEARKLVDDLLSTIKNDYYAFSAANAAPSYNNYYQYPVIQSIPAVETEGAEAVDPYAAYYNDPQYAAYMATYYQQYAEYYNQTAPAAENVENPTEGNQ